MKASALISAKLIPQKALASSSIKTARTCCELGEGANMARRKREGCAGFRTAAMPKSAGRRPHPKGELVLDVSL
jgi:hypothetical protein